MTSDTDREYVVTKNIGHIELALPTLATTPTSLYGRIRDELRAQIVSGLYAPHARLPSESELMTQYSVSRITVRNALAELEKEGILFKLAGKGVFVSKPKSYQSLGRLQGFAEAMAGHEIYNDVIGINTIPANAEVAVRLGLNEHAAVTELQRVRYLNREPVSFDATYVHPHIGARLAREDLATRDIFLILENDYGIALGFADLAIDALLADATLAVRLRIAIGDPVLRITRLTHTASGEPLDFEYLYCRVDNFQFRLRIER
jgi:GntR family transcriptional regulator